MKKIVMFLWAMLLLPSLFGCSSTEKSYTSQTFAMDTIMTLTAYGETGQQAVDEGSALLSHLSAQLSATDPESEIWALNHATGQWVSLSPETMEVLSLSIDLAEQTGGAFDPTIYPIMQLWGFITEDYYVPSQEELSALLPLVDYSAIELDMAQSRAKLPVGMAVDLGAVAKGYAADRLIDLFAELGVTHALLSLGGNVQVMGGKPAKELWNVGIQNPAANGYLASIKLFEGAVVTSGGYQRYFKDDSQVYWHILDPDTGTPARSTLRSVTVLSPSGTESDALSTALFVMGREDAEAFWRESQAFEMVLVEADGTLLITSGLVDSFTLVDAEEMPTLEVISP